MDKDKDKSLKVESEKVFDRRTGTNLTHGPDYEHHMITYYLVACCLQPFRDFWVGSNVGGTGAFDDVLVYTETETERKELFFLQLKHREDPTKKKVTVAEVEDEKYSKSFKSIMDIMTKKKSPGNVARTKALLQGVPFSNTKFIFMTNSDVAKTERLVSIDYDSFIKTNSQGPVYRLAANGVTDPKFLAKYFVITEQFGIDDNKLLKHIIEESLASLLDSKQFGSYADVADELVEFAKDWFLKMDKAITMADAKAKIAAVVLSSRKRVPEREYRTIVSDAEWNIWKLIIEPYQIVLFENADLILDRFYSPDHSHDFVRFDVDCFNVIVKCLQMDKNRKIIVENSCGYLNDSVNSLDSSEIATFRSLKNLPQRLIAMLDDCALRLQGRKCTFAAFLKENSVVADVFTVDDVLELLLNELSIGKGCEELDYYVNRSIPKIFVKIEALAEKPNSFFILIVEPCCRDACDSRLHSIYESTKNNRTEKNFLTVADDEVQETVSQCSNGAYKNVHVLKLHAVELNFMLEWKYSSDNAVEIDEFVDRNAIETVRNNYIEHVFDKSKTALIVANPGMGKTIFLKKLLNEFSVDKWVIFLTLNDLDLSKFKTFQSYLDKYRKELKPKVLHIFDAYLHRKSVVILFDGFDEVASRKKEEAMEIIKGASVQELNVIVSSRQVTKRYLEEQLCVLSYTLEPFRNEDKMNFFRMFYVNALAESGALSVETQQSIERFSTEILNRTTLSTWDTDFTGIPLQCRMLAETYVNECTNYCQTGELELPENLNLISLYETFIEKKFAIYCAEKLAQTVRSSMMQDLLEETKELFVEMHQDAAMQLLFPNVGVKLSARIVRNIKAGKETYGIITGIDENNDPIFVHRTFAEYFSAKWLVDVKNGDSDAERAKYLKCLLRPEYNVVRNVFDRIVCRDCERHTAVLNADKDAVGRISQRDGVERASECGRSALHLICARGAAHAWREETEWEGGETKTRAVMKRTEADDYLEVLDVLLRQGVQGGLYEDQVLSLTAQQYAEERNAYGIIDTLIKYSTTAARLYDWEQPFLSDLKTEDLLQMCAEHDYFNIATKVIDFTSLESSDTKRLLKRCCKRNSIQFAEMLIQRQDLKSKDLQAMSFNDEGTLLHVAAANGSMSMLSMLLEHINIHTRDNKGQTVLQVASEGGHLSAVKLLMDRGADMFQSDLYGRTSLHIAYNRRYKDLWEYVTSEDMFQIWCGDDVDVALSGKRGQTALHFACRSGNLEMVRWLIFKGADVNITDDDQMTALHFSCIGNSPNIEIVRLLLQKGSNIDAQDNCGKTALHWCVYKHKKETLKLLVDSGANPDLLTEKGKTALTMAKRRGLRDMFLTLFPVTNNVTESDVHCKAIYDGDEEARRKTFSDCTPPIAQLADIMIRAGFFYIGSESVNCFKCDCQIRGWTPEHDPWIRHARRNPNCEYVIQERGVEFINSCSEAPKEVEQRLFYYTYFTQKS